MYLFHLPPLPAPKLLILTEIKGLPALGNSRGKDDVLGVQSVPGIQLDSHIPTNICQLLWAQPVTPREVHPTWGNLFITP